MDKLLDHLKRYDKWAWDTETTEEHYIVAKLRGISFYFPDGYNAYYNYEDDQSLLPKLVEFFSSESTLKIGHEIKYDIHILNNLGIEVKGSIYDTKIAYWLLDPAEKEIGLKSLSRKHLGIEMVDYKDVDKENKKEFEEYAKRDARTTYLLYELSLKQLQNKGLLQYYYNTEMKFLKVLKDIERRGLCLNLERLEALRSSYQLELDNLKIDFLRSMFTSPEPQIEVDTIKKGQKIRKTVAFNFDSTSHMAQLLYGVKGYKCPEETETGRRSVSHSAIKTLVKDGVKEVEPLLQYRRLEKIVGTYIEPFLGEHNQNGKLHTFYKQHGTATGRLSGKAPNTQNIPVKTKEGRAVRECIIPSPGHVFLDSDFAQVELRIATHWSQEERLMRAFEEGRDPIDEVQSQLFGNIEKTKEARTITKAIVYGTLFGAGYRRLAEEANILPEKAKTFLTKYYRAFPALRKFQLVYPLTVKRNDGIATTLFKRPRYFKVLEEARVSKGYTYYSLLQPGDSTKEGNSKLHEAERNCLSFRIQGSASDIMKQAMLLADQAGLRVVAQVHDELLVECPIDKVEEQKATLERCMINSVKSLSVPLKVNIKVLDKWGVGEE